MASCSPARPASWGWRSSRATSSAPTATSTRSCARRTRTRGRGAPSRHDRARCSGDEDAYAGRVTRRPRRHRAARALGLRPSGLASSWRRSVTDIVHCAASVSFSLPLEESRRDQRRGHPPDARVRPSSAASAAACGTSPTSPPRTWPGPTRASSREDDLDVGQDFRNAYERSKFEAEQLVRAHARPPADPGLPARASSSASSRAAGRRRSTSSTRR